MMPYPEDMTPINNPGNQVPMECQMSFQATQKHLSEQLGFLLQLLQPSIPLLKIDEPIKREILAIICGINHQYSLSVTKTALALSWSNLPKDDPVWSTR